jgi:hypothetical protein
VFSVIVLSVRSNSCGVTSPSFLPFGAGTFSTIVPGFSSAAQITGSASLFRSISLA